MQITDDRSRDPKGCWVKAACALGGFRPMEGSSVPLKTLVVWWHKLKLMNVSSQTRRKRGDTTEAEEIFRVTNTNMFFESKKKVIDSNHLIFSFVLF